MAPSTAQLKTLSAQFVSLTGASERTAQRVANRDGLQYLKNANYKMNDAIDAGLFHIPHLIAIVARAPVPARRMGWEGMKTALPSRGLGLWSSKKKTDVKQQPGDGTKDKDKDKDKDKIRSVFFGGSNGGSGAGTPSPLEGDLNKLFDSLRGSSDNKDHMGIDSTTSYLTETLGVNPENAELLVVMEIVQAPAVGEITRKGFVDGWKSTGVQATNKDHAKHIKSLVKKLSTDQALFKKVYRHTFVAAKEQDQKAISLEYAQIYWETLFAPPGWQWASQNHNWLELWNSFLAAKWTRSVNKDMWNMTLEFAYKSLEDETLSFWSEDGAWPSVLDEFVAWCREEKGIKPETMDTDA
ncbi:GTP cyclohydrolase 1 [Verticillium dahliae VDG1]|nr:GTP cyclohydrolase 1 [Verticillium dahliae VDG1]